LGKGWNPRFVEERVEFRSIKISDPWKNVLKIIFGKRNFEKWIVLPYFAESVGPSYIQVGFFL